MNTKRMSSIRSFARVRMDRTNAQATAMPSLQRRARLPAAASRLRLATLWCALLCAWTSPLRSVAAEATPSPPPDLAALRQRIGDHLAQSRFARARWGVHIESLDTGTTLFSYDADKLFLPASNAKLYIGALALDRLGGDARIRTSVYATARAGGRGVLTGDLIVYGRGDPSVSARLHHGDLCKAFDPLVAVVQQAGVRMVRGDIVADTSFFRGPPFGSGWDWDDLQYYYGAEVSALSVNDNAMEVVVQPRERPGLPAAVMVRPYGGLLTVSNFATTCEPEGKANIRISRPLASNTVYVEGQLPVGHTGEVERLAVHRPAVWFANVFKESLERRGIRVTGGTRVVDAAIQASLDSAIRTGLVPNRGTLHELGSMSSPPVRELVRHMMKPSQNLHAQLLLLQVGATAEDRTHAKTWPLGVGAPTGRGLKTPGSKALNQPFETTEAAGIKALEAFLRQAGISSDQVQLEEGPGLSRRNLVTPAATVALLRYMDRHPCAPDFRESLPLAGVDGTLQNRMRQTAAAGNARAKTGSLGGVYTLSGYVTSGAGERLAFSLMLNNYRAPDPARSARAELDEIVVVLAQLPFRTALP